MNGGKVWQSQNASSQLTLSMNETQEIILCIPGPWVDRKAFIQALLNAHGGRYLFAGLIAMDTVTGDSIEIDFEAHHPAMKKAFHAASLDDSTLEKIGSHQLTAYLHFPLDLPGQRERMLSWASVFQKAGGIAIKVESTGISHGWGRWTEWMGSSWIANHYRAVVVMAGGSNGWYSCGMHLFGQPDAVTSAGGDEGRELLDTFNRYILLENPKLESSHTFSTEAGASKWVLEKTQDDRFAPDNLFYNPQGLWLLEKRV